MLPLGLLSLALLFPAPAPAADAPHSHGAPVLELTLDHGRKWRTDDALRQGMTEMRALMARNLPQAHAGHLERNAYRDLAERILAQVDFITRNCKLPPDADAQLHVVLARIIDGSEQMKTGPAPDAGLALVIAGLDAYAGHFDHPGWLSPGH
jgi:hypothetical protein